MKCWKKKLLRVFALWSFWLFFPHFLRPFHFVFRPAPALVMFSITCLSIFIICSLAYAKWRKKSFIIVELEYHANNISMKFHPNIEWQFSATKLNDFPFASRHRHAMSFVLRYNVYGFRTVFIMENKLWSNFQFYMSSHPEYIHY